MGDEGVLSELECEVLYSSSALNRALSQNPKIVILNSFAEQEKNNSIIQEVLSRSPNSKIIVIGKHVEDFKRTLAREIDTFLNENTTFKGLKIAIDQMNFAYQYGDNYENDISLGYRHQGASQAVWVVLSGLICFLIGLIFYFMD